MPQHFVYFFLAVSGLFLSIQGANAATFTVDTYSKPYEDGPGAFIVMEGDTAAGDYNRFLKVLPKAIARHGSEKFAIDVWLEGPGGNLDEAMKLGRLIYDLGFATLVAEDEECASACALIWIAGARLYMHPDARIGFHQAYTGDGDPTITGNGAVGYFLAEVGVKRGVVSYVLSAPPEDMTWLTPTIAEAIGLPLNILED